MQKSINNYLIEVEEEELAAFQFISCNLSYTYAWVVQLFHL